MIRNRFGQRYKWRVQSYKDGEFMLETVHTSDFSKDMEVKAAESIGSGN
jgi:hypothetical protein